MPDDLKGRQGAAAPPRPALWSPRAPQHPLADGARLRLFVLQGSGALGEAVALQLGVDLSDHEEREFEDGEHKTRTLFAVGGADVYVLHSLHGGPVQSPNDKLCRLLFFIGALKDNGAARVTAVAPYLCYARKDRRTKPHDPVTTRYLAAMFEAAGADAVVTVEVHNPAAFENAFRCRAVTLSAAPLFIDYVRRLPDERFCVVSPDSGGAKRAEQFREILEQVTGRPVASALAEKYRGGGRVWGEHFAGDVNGATAVIIDDLISTGGTLVRAAQAARKAGARRVLALAAHGLFMPGAAEALADPAIDRLAVSDTVPPFRLPDNGATRSKVDVLPAAALLAEAIRRLHENRPLTDLLVY